MSKKTNKKNKSMEAALWDSCNKLRNSVNTFEYMQVIFGLLFLRFATEKFNYRREELLNSEDKDFIEEPSFYLEKNVFFIPKPARWEEINKNAKQSNIGVLIDEALKALEDNNDSLKGTLPLNYYQRIAASMPGSNMASIITNISNIQIDKESSDDVIGKVYEYFMNKFAVLTKSDKGEFYTPASIVELIAELIEPYHGRVYDPCCGTGGMFIQSLKFVDKHHGNKKEISILGQEKQDTTYRLARMNLAIRGISANLGDKEDSTFTNDQHKGEKVDFIMANPPFNLKDWRGQDELTNDYRWNGYEIPPVSNANYAWILHMLSKLKNDGVAGFLLANGALSAGGDEYKIRKQLIENDKIEAIIVLPRNMFYYTDISVTLWIMRQHKKERVIERDGEKITLRNRENEILFMDLRRMNENISEDKTVYFTEKQIDKIKSVYHSWQSPEYKNTYHDVAEFSKSITLEIIKENDYSLVPSKYIEFVDRDLDIDFDKEMSRIQKQMKELLKEEKETHQMLRDAFKGIGYDVD